MTTNKNTLLATLWQVTIHDLEISFRRISDLFHPLLFFIITISLFPLALDPDPQFLQKLAPSVIWVAALLATLLALDGIFRNEFDDGTLELLVLSPHPLAILSMGKVFAHWIVTGLPLIMISGVLGLMLDLPDSAYPAMLVGLLLGTPAMSMIGAIGAALTVGVRNSGVLITLIILPLYIPILIFGTSAIQAAVLQQDWTGQILLLAGILVLCITLAPIAIATGLKISLN